MKYIILFLLFTTFSLKSQNELKGIRISGNNIVFHIQNLYPGELSIIALNEPRLFDHFIPPIDCDIIKIENTKTDDYFVLSFSETEYFKPFRVHIHTSGDGGIFSTYKVFPEKKLGMYDFRIEKIK